MSQLVRKIVSQFVSISPFPKAIIIYGTVISLVLFLCTLGVLLYSRCYIHDYKLMLTSISALNVCPTLFAEAVVGGVLMDYLAKSR